MSGLDLSDISAAELAPVPADEARYVEGLQR
jgi:hypothetical protein